jgi:3-(3-hydroxy-phenyl)propionate hydroxylase
VKVLRVATAPDAPSADVIDKDGLLTQRYDLRPGTAYLFRPDQHVSARWRKPTAAQVKSAVKCALAIN